ncbi:protein NATD1-like [Cololabis saira]|uniref:protein NATD1-like n=1 Tax=Cololabis saira TaxID=129043 RepID=UPI002AD420B9|nr:protein NATD1-like [Cololabis saira]
MAFKITSRLSKLSPRFMSWQTEGSSLNCKGLTVEHDRHNLRFTVRPGSGAEAGEAAVLRYQFTGDKEVDLMSTFVPESFRGRGVAALLSQAAIDFVVQENLKARVSCWYIQKYMEENPDQQRQDRIIP